MKAIVFAAGALSLLTANAFGADLGLPIKAAPMAAPLPGLVATPAGRWRRLGQKNENYSAEPSLRSADLLPKR